MVNASNPTGMDQQQKVNMAIIIHLGKTECMNYKYKDFNCHEWLYYLAWDIIKSTAKFSPPKPGNTASIANAASVVNVLSIANVASVANVASIADGADIGDDGVDVESTNENDSTSQGSSKGKKGAEQDAKRKKEVKEKTKEIRKLRKVMVAKLESSNHLAHVLELKTVVDLTVGGADPDEYESAKKAN